MRKVDDGEEKKEKRKEKKIMTFIVATTSLPVDRPNADRLERRTLVPKKLGPLRHKRIWSQNLGGAVAFHALMTSLCPNGFNTHKTQQCKRLLKHGRFL